MQGPAARRVQPRPADATTRAHYERQLLAELADAGEAQGAAAEWIAALLAHRAPSALALLVVDQLEELFTQAIADELAQLLASRVS